ncbi:hypothetical protein PUN28_007434 [Cardiocondyla obscurior]|uniref:Uncharacterized protein n=1 Tax=Cardiocondyla obscurior TaxID=286306 RepID=A0AAW2G5K9_9HYME
MTFLLRRDQNLVVNDENFENDLLGKNYNIVRRLVNNLRRINFPLSVSKFSRHETHPHRENAP